MTMLISAFLSFLSFCICIICKNKPRIIMAFGLATSLFSGVSMYLFWVALEQSGRDVGYNGPWMSPVIPVVYILFICLGIIFFSICIYKRKKSNNDIRENNK